MNAALLRRQLVYWLLRRGWPGMLGLALIAAAGAYHLLVLTPEGTRHRQFEQRIAEAAARLRDGAPDHAAATPAEQLTAFHRTFPAEPAIPDWLANIYAIAERQHLELEVGEYALTPAKAGRLDQLRIVFPVKGGYPQIRRFIAAALATAPALALDSVHLKREKIADGSVDARIVFLLYLEKAE